MCIFISLSVHNFFQILTEYLEPNCHTHLTPQPKHTLLRTPTKGIEFEC